MDPAAPDESEVRVAVSTLLDRPVTSLSWEATPVDPARRIHSVTEGVVRIRGEADGAPFSLVVKATRLGKDADPGGLWVSHADPAHRGYWKREWLAFASGLLTALPGRLRAPRLLLASEPSENRAWLWLEDVDGLPGTAWEDDHYAAAAYDLGTTQGAYAAGRALPDEPWLSRDWLAAWVATAQRWWPLVDDDTVWADDRLADVAALRPRARQVWAVRDALLAVVAQAPRTLVHHDLWPTNLFAGTDGRTVAIDWSSVGVGGLGADLDQITLDPVWMQVLPGGDLDALERAVLPAYAGGLRAAGAEVSDAEVRRWYAAVAGLRYTSVLAPQAELAGDPARVEALEQRWSRPFAALQADRARVIARSLDLAEECLG